MLPPELQSMRTDLDIRRPALTDGAAFADWIADWQGDPYDLYDWIFARAWTDSTGMWRPATACALTAFRPS
jgi:hypothetical protein